MRPKSRIIQFESGASIIEFGFVAFIFFLILWGIFEFGRAFYVRNSLQHLTRCIAREAVILKPSQYNAAKASCLMQMGGSGSNYYWPFYQLVPGDMKSYFRIRYYFSGGGWVEQPGTTYDNQIEACLTGSGNCITYVQVYVPNRPILQEYRLVRSWLGIGDVAFEPESSTMMPAESMGYAP